MKKFISWRRVSTKRQGISGLGLQAQSSIIDYFVKSEDGELIADYEEVYTGKDLQGCKELQKAKEHCKRLNATLIIAKTDRFRTVIEALQIFEEMRGDIYFCDLPHTDKFTLTLFFALAEREAKLVSIRTKSALQAKRDRGECLGRASEKYKIDEENQHVGIIKSAKKRNKNNVCSNDFIALCRILKRVYKPLNDSSTQDELFMLNWCNVKDEVLRSLTKDNLLVVMQNMIEANQYNNTLFAKYNFKDVDYMLKLLKSKIYTIFRSINTYNLYN